MSALKYYMEDLWSRVESKRKALASFTDEQRAGKSTLAVRLEIEIDVLRDEAGRLLNYASEESAELRDVVAKLADLRKKT